MKLCVGRRWHTDLHSAVFCCLRPNGYTLSFVLLASLSVMVRPTSALLWAPLCLWHLHQCRGRKFWPFVRVVVTGGYGDVTLSLCSVHDVLFLCFMCVCVDLLASWVNVLLVTVL